MTTSKGWIGIDLDGTLAEYDGVWKGADVIGKPVPVMVERVKAWLAKGREVKIFTARVAVKEDKDPHEAEACRAAIVAWCVEHLGQALEVTATKDYGCIQIWDDRAVAVQSNTGRCIWRHCDSLDEEIGLRLVPIRRENGYDIVLRKIEQDEADKLWQEMKGPTWPSR